MTKDEIERVTGKLCPLERERITGWQGPGGAAYNAISEGLCEMGLLLSNWSLSPSSVARCYLVLTAGAGQKKGPLREGRPLKVQGVRATNPETWPV